MRQDGMLSGAGGTSSWLSRIVDWAKNSSFLRLLVVITLCAELLTALLNVINGYLWWGEDTWKLYMVGVIDAFFVSVIALPVIIFIILRLKQTEKESADKSAYLDNILNTSTDMAIAATDMGFRVTLFNPAAEEMFGYRAEEVIGRDVRHLHHGEGIDPERFAAALDVFERDGELTFSLANARGVGMQYLDIRVSGIMDEDGRQTGYALMARDVTERRSYEQALKESETKFRTLVEHSLVGVAIIQDGRYAYINPRHAEMLGLTQAEMMSLESVMDRVHPDDRETVAENIRKRTTGEVRDIRYRFRFLKKDGSVVYVEVHGTTSEYGGRAAVISSVLDITEWVKAEDDIRKLNEELEQRVAERTAELRDSEARYRMLMEQASDGIGIMGRDGAILKVNRRLCELLGYSEQEVLSLGIEDIFVVDELPFVISDLIDIRSGATVVRERTVRRKDGSTIQAEISAKLLDDGSVLAIGRDITVRKEAERALRASEERLRHVVEHMPVMMNAFDENWNIVVWNRECERVTGYTSEEVVNNPDIFDRFYPEKDYHNVMLGEWRDRGNNYRDWEWDITCRDGSVKTIAWSNRSDVISIPGWAAWGIGIDVTERNKALHELGISEHSYRTLAENLPGIVYRVVLNGCNGMQFFNDMLEPLTGYRPDELSPGECCSIDTLIHPDDREVVIANIKDAVREYRPFLVEYRLMHKDGSARYMQERGRPVRGFNGKPPYIDGVILDITELKKAQEEREEMQARLNESLRLEAIGNMAGGIAHDFNNLLTVIQGDNELIRLSLDEDHPAMQYAGHIDSAASRASELIRKLMIFSRRKPMARIPIDINKTVDEITAMLKRVLGKGITVETDLEPGIWTPEADLSGVEQVVMNLALNARDAMPEGGTLRISTENVELGEDAAGAGGMLRPGRFVRLSVSDTGVGMDEDTKKRIFEPFFTTKGKGRGTGLGLSVVYGIVREHGGWIEVTSLPGKGSTFDAYFEVAG